MKPFSLLIKPTSADCNLRCQYCFYLGRQQLYPQTRTHRMSDNVLDGMIASFMRTDQPQYSFGWQGGEPILMGMDFFKRVIELQQKQAREHPDRLLVGVSRLGDLSEVRAAETAVECPVCGMRVPTLLCRRLS